MRGAAQRCPDLVRPAGQAAISRIRAQAQELSPGRALLEARRDGAPVGLQGDLERLPGEKDCRTRPQSLRAVRRTVQQRTRCPEQLARKRFVTGAHGAAAIAAASFRDRSINSVGSSECPLCAPALQTLKTST